MFPASGKGTTDSIFWSLLLTASPGPTDPPSSLLLKQKPDAAGCKQPGMLSRCWELRHPFWASTLFLLLPPPPPSLLSFSCLAPLPPPPHPSLFTSLPPPPPIPSPTPYPGSSELMGTLLSRPPPRPLSGLGPQHLIPVCH